MKVSAVSGLVQFSVAREKTASDATPPVLISASETLRSPLTPLFDGATLDGWQQAGPSGFSVVDGTLQSSGGMGLLWYTRKQFGDFIRADIARWSALARERNISLD